jgi:chlorobactene glucosyltransferase
MILIYQIAVLVSLLVFLAILLRNLVDLPALPQNLPNTGPLVSVLVPARNEALNIERCVRSLLQQNYAPFEILVLDDGSTDATFELLQTLAGESNERLRILTGEPLPEGWHGKAWACDQLGRQAKGELLLFTDADTMHAADALSRSVAAMEESRSDMLSLTPRQELCSFWEKLVVPLVYVILMCYLPLRLVRTSRNPAFCFANGQFILFRRAFYKRINGHAAVREAIVEDVWLCKAVKRAGGRVVAFNGSDAVSCRMYRSFGDIWEGFSKNLYAGLGYSTSGLFLLMVLTVAFYIAPYAFFFQALYTGQFSASLFWFPLIQITVALICRLIIARLFSQSLSMVFLHLLSQVVLLAIALNSFWVIKSGRGARWKGRCYNFT